MTGYDQAAQFYDLFANNDDLAFHFLFAKQQDGPILDLASGTARVTIPLAEKGFTVFGLESSQGMLKIANNKISKLAENIQQRIKLQQGDMVNFTFDMKFDLIIIPNSFGHCLTTNRQRKCLEAVKNHLTDKGIFILDLFPGGTLQKEGSFTNEKPLDETKKVIRKGSYTTDFIKQIAEYNLEYLLIEENKTIKHFTEYSKVAVIFNREINLLLEIVGLKIVNEFCDWQKNPYRSTPDCTRRILILQKEKK
jgi:SAM-dependent methyltransferase